MGLHEAEIRLGLIRIDPTMKLLGAEAETRLEVRS